MLLRRRSTAARCASTSSEPSSERARATSLSWLARSPRSVPTARCPWPSRPATTASTPSCIRSTAMTRAPVVAKASATVRPMPPAAPVTITPFPSRPAPTLQAMVASTAQLAAEPVLLDDLFPDLDAESRRHGHVDPAIPLLERRRHQLVLHRVFQWLHFEDQAPIGDRGERQAGGRDDRAAPGVGVVPDRGALDQLDELLEAGDAFRASRVAAHDVDDPGRDEPLIAGHVPFSLAGGDERLRVLAQRAEALDILRFQRFLDPAQVVCLEGVDQADGVAHVPQQGLAAVDHDVGPGPDRLAQQPDKRDVALRLIAEAGRTALAEADFDALVAVLAHIRAM